jgi:2-polyprenyl-3-methyl-5-hydroxy-6-metoxy-1,4-benzoquinol methylase
VAITDEALTERFVVALGEAISGSVLDVACGPGILSAAIAKSARDVVALARLRGLAGFRDAHLL